MAHPRSHDPRQVDHGVQLANQIDLLGTPRVSSANGASSTAVESGDLKARLEAQVASLPTPLSRDWKGASGRAMKGLAEDLPSAAEGLLLPTPTASQPGGTAEQHLARKNRNGGNRKTVTDIGMVVEQLLPTATASDHKASGGSNPSNVTLTDALVRGHGHAPRDSEGTGPRFDDGNSSSDALPLTPPSTDGSPLDS